MGEDDFFLRSHSRMSVAPIWSGGDEDTESANAHGLQRTDRDTA